MLVGYLNGLAYRSETLRHRFQNPQNIFRLIFDFCVSGDKSDCDDFNFETSVTFQRDEDCHRVVDARVRVDDHFASPIHLACKYKRTTNLSHSIFRMNRDWAEARR